jgi:hypothetical protein
VPINGDVLNTVHKTQNPQIYNLIEKAQTTLQPSRLTSQQSNQSPIQNPSLQTPLQPLSSTSPPFDSNIDQLEEESKKRSREPSPTPSQTSVKQYKLDTLNQDPSLGI